MQEVLNKREMKKLQSKQKILDSAIYLFSTKGLKETSISDITKEAKLGTGTFYNYFSSKDDLLNHLLDNIAKDIQKYYKNLQKDDLPICSILRKIVLYCGEVFLHNRFILPLFARATDKSALQNRNFNVGMVRVFPFKPLFDQILTKGQEMGEFRSDIPAEIVTEMFHSLFQTASFSTLPISYLNNVTYKLELIISGIKVRRI